MLPDTLRAAPAAEETPAPTVEAAPASRTALATFGGGCFWCTEAVFEQTRGVLSAVSGYSGGPLPNPTYEAICTGRTGHAEVTQVEYDPAKVSYAELLEIFFRTHDPTTLNRQGGDVGTQYRSVVFYHNDEQKRVTEEVIAKLTTAGVYDDPIVTQVTPLGQFYEAEKYHQNYFANNPEQGYCRAVIQPKLAKFRRVFEEHVKSSEN
ncbi:MAG: peptide-methionine (S)-S-oxide reductase MsrA [Lacipirellulaceae bacterium]